MENASKYRVTAQLDANDYQEFRSDNLTRADKLFHKWAAEHPGHDITLWEWLVDHWELSEIHRGQAM